ncbi:hypothetical protein [Paraburkholderia megapolitana]|uniref:hypothetical protein n=1 Tax=Paraburkholderia megapolitana TaxID=420953 RepID=UPI0038B9E5EB
MHAQVFVIQRRSLPVFSNHATGFLQTAQAGKSRSLPFNLSAALILAAFGLWQYWLIWIMLQLDHGIALAWQLVLAGPSKWADFINWLAQNYHVAISAHPGSHGAEASTQNMLWIWFGEAVIIFAVALLVAWVGSRRIYSERAGKWAETTLKVDVAAVDATSDALRAAFERSRGSPPKPIAPNPPRRVLYSNWSRCLLTRACVRSALPR